MRAGLPSPHPPRVAVVAFGWAAALGCAHAPPPADPPLRHCFRIAALGANGGAAVYESGAPGFVEGARPDPAYHLELRPGDTVTTLPQRTCVADGLCGSGGELRPAVLGLAEKDEFRFAETAAPGSVDLQDLGTGSRRATLDLRPARLGGREWTLALDASPEPWVLWRAPETLAPTRARWYRAGPRLYVELDLSGPGVACVVARADLLRVEAGLLNREARARLGERKAAEAEVLLRRAVELAPEDADSTYNLARALALQSRPDDALRWLARALLLDEGGRLTGLAREDPDFASLRDRDDFRLLVAEP